MNPKEWYVTEHDVDKTQAGSEPRFRIHSERIHAAEISAAKRTVAGPMVWGEALRMMGKLNSEGTKS